MKGWLASAQSGVIKKTQGIEEVGCTILYFVVVYQHGWVGFVDNTVLVVSRPQLIEFQPENFPRTNQRRTYVTGWKPLLFCSFSQKEVELIHLNRNVFRKTILLNWCKRKLLTSVTGRFSPDDLTMNPWCCFYFVEVNKNNAELDY